MAQKHKEKRTDGKWNIAERGPRKVCVCRCCVCRARKEEKKNRVDYSIDLVTSDRGWGAEEGRSEWEWHSDAEGRAIEDATEEPGCREDETSPCSRAPLWEEAPGVLLAAAEFSSWTKDGGGGPARRCGWWSGWWAGFIVSERGCICSVWGLDSFEEGEGTTEEGEDGGESSKLPSVEGGLAQLPSPWM